MNGAHPSHFHLLAEWFAALADPSRLALLWQLKQGEANVTTLVEATGIGQASASKHLATLRRVGLVTVQRSGQQMIYRIAEPALEQICALVCNSLAERQALLAQAMAAIHQPGAVLGEEIDGP